MGSRRLLFLALMAGTWGSAASGQPFEVALIADTSFYSPASGEGVVDAEIRFTDLAPQVNTYITCYSLAVSHDPARLTIVTIEEGPTIAALNGGGGPDFVDIDTFGDGLTIGVSVSFLGTENLYVPAPLVAYRLRYETQPAAFIGDLVGAVTQLHWEPGPYLGSPAPTPPVAPVYTVICYGDGGLTPLMVDATVPLLPGPQFRRGDVNEDGSFDIGDAICVIAYLFQGSHVACPRSMDANADQQVDIADAIAMLGTLFSQGPVLPMPFGQCGTDHSSLVPCESYAGCP